jgi:hypothetical protein
MPSIPSVTDTDAEDVVWGLQTADALWKRGERIDAIVWLRRSAQAAMDSNALTRAVELGRIAAELSDWLATAPSAAPPPPLAPFAAGADVARDDLSGSIDVPVSVDVPIAAEAASDEARANLPLPPTFEPGPEAPPLASEREEATVDSVSGPSPSVPPAEQVHAGMFNPWDEKAPPVAPPAPPVTGAIPPRPPSPSLAEVIAATAPMRARAPSLASVEFASGSSDDELSEEVLTSVKPASMPGMPVASVPPPPLAPRISLAPPSTGAPPPSPSTGAAPPRKPPPLPPRARIAKPPIPVAPPSDADVETSAPRIDSASAPSPDDTRVDAPHELVGITPAPPPPVIAEPPVIAPPPPVTEPSPALDLEDVEAFADLPDDARLAFAAAAKLDRLAEGDEVSHFALAYVLEGEVDVAATMVDAAAMRLRAGAVLRSRGTTSESVPMRLVAVAPGAVTATWSDGEVAKAFKSCPWVEEDLRAAADRMLTLVGITIGPLGERLDASIREAILARLTIRNLQPGEVVVEAGQVVPGLFLVGIGELQLVKPDGETVVVGSGEFLFATEVLGAGSAPYTARAGTGGALVMFGDRHVAQELLVTCPPLLEVFAGM